MGLFDKIFNKKNVEDLKKESSRYESLNMYSPTFYNFSGTVYETEITKSAIHSIATNISKLKPELVGDKYQKLGKKIQFKMNDFMDTTKFLYRLATIFEVDTTAFIIPLYDKYYQIIEGYYPILPSRSEIIDVEGIPFLRYTFSNGQRAVIEWERVGVLTKFQYESDFFGGGNSSLNPTMNLISIQEQGMVDAIKQSAKIRFMAKLTQTYHAEDIKKERDRFSKENLSSDNKSGMIFYDGKYQDIKQVESKAEYLDHEQMKIIQNNVFNYFGVNENILQNKYDEEEWNAFYESKIEPFAIQLSLVMTNMTFTEEEIENGSMIYFSANRLQYASNNTKLEVSTKLFDRGILSVNEVKDIWNMAHVEDGDKYYIRREYVEMDLLDYEEKEKNEKNKVGEKDNAL